MSLHTLGVCIYLLVCIYVFVCVYKCVYKFLFVYEDFTDDRASYTRYGVALISRIDQIRGLFYKRALQNRRYSAKEIYILREPTVRSHLISVYLRTGWRRCIAALSCCSESSKEPLISGLFCGKWPINMRHPMHLCHPVSPARLRYFRIGICLCVCCIPVCEDRTSTRGCAIAYCGKRILLQNKNNALYTRCIYILCKCICVCVCLCMYTYVCMHKCVFVNVCACGYKCICTYTYWCIHMYM